MYCGYCGNELGSNEQVCRGCGAREGNDINYCTSCGSLRKNKKKTRCVFCNHTFKDIEKEPTKSNPIKVNGKIGGFIAVISVGGVFIATVLELYRDFTETNGYISSKGYVSVAEMHTQIPGQIISVVIMGIVLIVFIFGWIGEMRKKDTKE
ncbi:MAG: hypothetical protein ACRDAU_08680 [Clostridium sp.]